MGDFGRLPSVSQNSKTSTDMESLHLETARPSLSTASSYDSVLSTQMEKSSMLPWCPVRSISQSSEDNATPAPDNGRSRLRGSIYTIGFFILFMTSPFNFAADDLFAASIPAISRAFRISHEQAQAQAYRWDSFSYGFASLGAPCAAFLASFFWPTWISVVGSSMAATGAAFVLAGLREASNKFIRGGLGLRATGAEMQIQMLFPIIKQWTDSLPNSEAVGLIYMERAVALVNGVIYPIIAASPLLALSGSWKVVTFGLAACFGLSCLSASVLCMLVRPRKSTIVKSEKQVLKLSDRVSLFIERLRQQVFGLVKYIWASPSSVVILVERNVMLSIQDSANKALATIIIVANFKSYPDKVEQLSRLALILPAFSMLGTTFIYTWLSSRHETLRLFSQQWNLFLMSFSILLTAGNWYLTTLDLGVPILISMIVLSGVLRGLSNCIIAYPIGIAYDGRATGINPSNIMPLVSNLLQNTFFSFGAWFTLSVADQAGSENRFLVYQCIPFYAYLALAGAFAIHGGVQWRLRRRLR